MNTVQYVLMVLLSLPGAYHDKETFEQRVERMSVVARAIGDASARATCTDRFDKPECERIWSGPRKQLALLLVTKAWWESRLAKNVHEGKCRKFECDATKLANGTTVFRARTIWQMQKTSLVTTQEWNTMVGTDFEATRTAAWAATRILARGKNKCGSTFGAMSFYGRSRCAWTGARVREVFYRKLINKTQQQFEADADRHKAAEAKRDDSG